MTARRMPGRRSLHGMTGGLITYAIEALVVVKLATPTWEPSNVVRTAL
jgi:hypothetical protein